MTFDELLEILSDLHPEVDFTTETGLIDNKVLDSFDIVSIVTEISADFDISIPAGRSFRRTSTPPRPSLSWWSACPMRTESLPERRNS